MNLDSYFAAKAFDDKFILDLICKPPEKRLDSYFFNSEGKISSGFKRGITLNFLQQSSTRVEISINSKLIYTVLFGSIHLINV